MNMGKSMYVIGFDVFKFQRVMITAYVNACHGAFITHCYGYIYSSRFFRHLLPLLVLLFFFQHLLIMSSCWKTHWSGLNSQIEAHMVIFFFSTHFLFNCSTNIPAFSHHLLAKTASKQTWPFYISNGISHCPLQQRINLFKQASSVVSLSL